MFEKDKTYTYKQIYTVAQKFYPLGEAITAIVNNQEYIFHPSDRGYMLYMLNDVEVNPIVRYGPNAQMYFYVLEKHIKLLNHFWINWELTSYGHGVPCVDVTRPYGNNGILSDIIDILGLPYKFDDALDGYPDEIEARIRQLHRETLVAMQILVRNGRIELGEYAADKHNQNWKSVDNNPD